MNAVLSIPAAVLVRKSLRIEVAPPPRVVRIIAHPIAWPSPTEKRNRAALRLTWRCTTEEGDLLIPETDHPLTDAAAVLLTERGFPAETLVTLRHDGKGYDSFGPMKLGPAAAKGVKRMERKARQKPADLQNTAGSEVGGPTPQRRVRSRLNARRTSLS